MKQGSAPTTNIDDLLRNLGQLTGSNRQITSEDERFFRQHESEMPLDKMFDQFDYRRD